jgi:hypothetical protein
LWLCLSWQLYTFTCLFVGWKARVRRSPYSLKGKAITFNDRIDKILEEPKMPKTQSMQHVDKHTLRAIVVDDNMYWIINNAFYVADIVDGNVEENTTRLVDTMTMDKVQLDKIMFIVEKLREGD